jgi:hypothetical protein
LGQAPRQLIALRAADLRRRNIPFVLATGYGDAT